MAHFKFGIALDLPPLTIKQPDGSGTGFDYEIAQALADACGDRVTMVVQEFDGLIPALRVRKCDAIIGFISITDDRKKSVDFTKRYALSPSSLVGRQGLELSDSLDEVKGLKVGVQRGSCHSRFAADVLAPKGAVVVPYGTVPEAALDLAAGRLDLAVADTVALEGWFLKTDAGRSFAFCGPLLTDTKYFGDGIGLAVRKGDDALREKLNDAIDAIRANGRYKEIEARYFNFDIYGPDAL